MPPSPNEPPQSPSKGHERLEGQVEAVIFQADDGDFAVVSLTTDSGMVTAAGKLAPVHQGQHLQLHGIWQKHSKYGKQFRAEWAEATTPTTLAGLEKYLGSGAFPGIGAETAKRLVDHFGEKVLEAFAKGPHELKQVEGIGPVRAKKIAGAFLEGQEEHRVMAELRGFGLSASQTRDLYERWGAAAVENVRKDPWALIDRVRGVGFRTAETIGEALGLPKDCTERGRGIILHLLKEASREGHVCLPRDSVWDQLSSLGLNEDTIAEAAATLQQRARIVFQEGPTAQGEQQAWWYLMPLWEAEHGLATQIQRLQESAHAHRVEQATLQNALQRTDYVPDESQLAAVNMALRESVSVITGGPGTGKTTTLRLLLDVLAATQGGEVKLASPTGRAAKRLQEATGREASTIHRLLGFEPHSGDFQHNEDQPIEALYIVVDEVSMMDIELAHALTCAVGNGCRILFVGDADQLPSVGAGSVLRDLVESRAIPTTRLQHIHRQESGSGITSAAHSILEGLVPETMTGTSGDFFATYRDDPAETLDLIERVVCERIPEKYGLHPQRDILILAPMYKGALGVDAINERIGARLNPTQFDLSGDATSNPQAFVVGDKVMAIRNDYEREVFNGDVGIITEMLAGGVVVEFSDGLVEYPTEELSNLLKAWCVTVHRSQGSEAPAVVLVLANAHHMMLRRNLLYTGVTRGKQLVTIIGSQHALRKAVLNNEENLRYGLLKARLDHQSSS